MTAGTQLDFAVTAQAGSTVLVKDGNTVLVTLANFSPAADSPVTLTLADGTHTLSVEATDTAGNTSAQSEELVLTVDTAAPAKPAAPDLLESSDSFDNVAGLVGPQWTNSDNITGIAQPAFSGTAEANARIRVYANGVLVGQGVANPDGSWEVTVEPLVDGAYAITAEAEDLAGNVSPLSGVLNITVDTLAPQRPTLDLADALDTGSSDLDNVTNTPNDVAITVTAEAGRRVLIKDGETVVDDFWIAGTTATRTLTLGDGTHLLSAEAFDLAGNLSAQSEVLELTIDRTAPAFFLLPSNRTVERQMIQTGSN